MDKRLVQDLKETIEKRAFVYVFNSSISHYTVQVLVAAPNACTLARRYAYMHSRRRDIVSDKLGYRIIVKLSETRSLAPSRLGKPYPNFLCRPSVAEVRHSSTSG